MYILRILPAPRAGIGQTVHGRSMALYQPLRFLPLHTIPSFFLSALYTVLGGETLQDGQIYFGSREPAFMETQNAARHNRAAVRVLPLNSHSHPYQEEEKQVSGIECVEEPLGNFGLHMGGQEDGGRG